MGNHVHDLLEPAQPAVLPRLMHWLNWYSALCFNRMLRRTGQSRERRYHRSGFARDDHVRADKRSAPSMAIPGLLGSRPAFFYRSSDDASSARLSEDGLTQGPPGLLDPGRNAGHVQRAGPQLLPARSPGDQAQAARHERLRRPAAPLAFQGTGARAIRATRPPGLRAARPRLVRPCGGPAHKPLISGSLRSIFLGKHRCSPHLAWDGKYSTPVTLD
jgi:REP element-mobilizing transposase RayT